MIEIIINNIFLIGVCTLMSLLTGLITAIWLTSYLVSKYQQVMEDYIDQKYSNLLEILNQIVEGAIRGGIKEANIKVEKEKQICPFSKSTQFKVEF